MDEGRAFRRRLAAAIEASPLSRPEIADELGTAAPRLSEWASEGGTRMPGFHFLAKLPGVLGVSGHWLLTGEGSMRPDPKGEPPLELAAYKAIAAIVRAADRVSPPTQSGATPALPAEASQEEGETDLPGTEEGPDGERGIV